MPGAEFDQIGIAFNAAAAIRTGGTPVPPPDIAMTVDYIEGATVIHQAPGTYDFLLPDGEGIEPNETLILPALTARVGFAGPPPAATVIGVNDPANPRRKLVITRDGGGQPTDLDFNVLIGRRTSST